MSDRCLMAKILEEAVSTPTLADISGGVSGLQVALGLGPGGHEAQPWTLRGASSECSGRGGRGRTPHQSQSKRPSNQQKLTHTPWPGTFHLEISCGQDTVPGERDFYPMCAIATDTLGCDMQSFEHGIKFCSLTFERIFASINIRYIVLSFTYLVVSLCGLEGVTVFTNQVRKFPYPSTV